MYSITLFIKIVNKMSFIPVLKRRLKNYTFLEIGNNIRFMFIIYKKKFWLINIIYKFLQKVKRKMLSKSFPKKYIISKFVHFTETNF